MREKIDSEPLHAHLAQVNIAIGLTRLPVAHHRLHVDCLLHDHQTLADQTLQLEEGGRGQDGDHLARLHRDLVLVERAECDVETVQGDAGVHYLHIDIVLHPIRPPTTEETRKVWRLLQIQFVKLPTLTQSSDSDVTVFTSLKHFHVNFEKIKMNLR